MSFYAHILEHIKPSETLLLAALAKEMKQKGLKVIGMTVGEPDDFTPPHVKEAAIDAINKNLTFYTSFYGIEELRKAIVEYVKKYYMVDYDTDNTIVTSGAKQAIYNALKATLNPNDEVIVIAPYWVSYPDMVKINGGIPVICNAQEDGQLNIAHLKTLINPRTKWIILNSPNNPSGVVYNEQSIKALVEIMHENKNLNIMSDDIYHQLIYEGKFLSPLHFDPELKNRILIINGVSKSCSMTGWRVGFAIGEKKLIKNMGKIQSQSTSCISSISQYAALAALTELDKTMDFIDKMNKKNNDKRLRLIDFFAQNGIEFIKSNGAFYFLLSCKKYYGKTSSKGLLIENDVDFSKFLLNEHLISAVPGKAFGMENYIRISYTIKDEDIEEFMKRMKQINEELLSK